MRHIGVRWGDVHYVGHQTAPGLLKARSFEEAIRLSAGRLARFVHLESFLPIPGVPTKALPGSVFAALLPVLLALNACKTAPAPPVHPTLPPAQVEAPPPPPPEVIIPKHKPAATPAAAAETPKPEPLPADLVGLGAGDVEQRLGPPQSKRDVPPAIVWQYASGTCTADVYFYTDLQSGGLRALYVDVKGDDGNDRRHPSCYQRIVTASRRTGADAPPAR